MCVILRRVGNIPTNFGVSGTFYSQLVGQHLSDAPHDLATLTFDLGGPDRRLSVIWVICKPSLKFIGLPVRKILRIYYVSINRRGDLDF